MKTRAQAKKDLMEVDEPSYDILEWFPILYCQNVFKYLNGSDVIQASAVNKEWRKFAGEKQQMTKVKLVFDEYNSQALDPKSVEMIKKSKQRYQNIEFRNISDRFAKYIPEVLANRAGSWKSVKWWRCRINENEVLTAIFKIIEPSVEKLSFICMGLSGIPVNADPKWSFPRLKDLEGDLTSSHLCEAFSYCTSLVNFKWYRCFLPSTRFVSTLLRNNHNLQNLAARACDISLENSVDFKFKLKKLYLNQGSSAHRDITRWFLETQAQTLESLQLETSFNRDSLDLILNMPRLTSLTTSYSQMRDAISDRTRPLPGNNSITYLELQSCVYRDEPLFETLFRALMSLKHFKCNQIHDQMLSTLAREVPALESLEIDSFSSRFPEGDVFPAIKKFKVQRFGEDLQEPTGGGNFKSLARKEMRKAR